MKGCVLRDPEAGEELKDRQENAVKMVQLFGKRTCDALWLFSLSFSLSLSLRLCFASRAAAAIMPSWVRSERGKGEESPQDSHCNASEANESEALLQSLSLSCSCFRLPAVSLLSTSLSRKEANRIVAACTHRNPDVLMERLSPLLSSPTAVAYAALSFSLEQRLRGRSA